MQQQNHLLLYRRRLGYEFTIIGTGLSKRRLSLIYGLILLAIKFCASHGAPTIQFSEPDGAFLLKSVSNVDYYHGSSSSSGPSSSFFSFSNVMNNNNKQHWSSNNYTFLLLKDGHVGNKIIVKEAGIMAEENLEANQAIGNLTTSVQSSLLIQILTTKLSKEQPTVRIFVYQKVALLNQKRQKLPPPCVLVYAVYKSEVVFGQCRPQPHQQGSCTIDLIVPLAWWPKHPYVTVSQAAERNENNWPPPTPIKRPKTMIRIGFAASLDYDQICHNEPTVMAPKAIERATFDKTLSYVGDVELIETAEYVCLPFDKILNILVPNREFHPGDIFTSTIFYRYNPTYTDQPPHLFQIKCQAVGGIRILGAEAVPHSEWTTPVDMNYKLSTLTVTAFYRGQLNANESWSGEVITLVLQVNNENSGKSGELSTTFSSSSSSSHENASTANHKKPTLLSSISYVVNDMRQSADHVFDALYDKNESFTKTLNVQTSFNIEKDTVQTLIPVGKFDFVNTAVLTGNQVSVSLRILSLTFAGIVSDVTLQSFCEPRELSVLKVTPSCTSVYVDGSESRGDISATINITFGNYKTTALYNIWYPEFPVDIVLADPVLHAIKSWKVDHKAGSTWNRRKRNSTFAPDYQKLRSSCRLRYQESMIKVYARFRVDDLTTGRRSYLGGRKTQMDVTYLSRAHLKVVDSRIAQIKIIDSVVFVQGLYPGRTELQLISSYSRIPFGAAQIEVTNEKLSVRNLRAQTLAGVNFRISALDTTQQQPDLYLLTVHRSTLFTKKYQEGRLNIEVEYSNGFTFPLEFISPDDYTLDVAVKDNSLALLHANGERFSSMNSIGSSYYHDQRPVPSFLTLDETKGNLLYISLFSSPACRHGTDGPLFSTMVYVEASFGGKSDWPVLNNKNNQSESTTPKLPDHSSFITDDRYFSAMEPQKFKGVGGIAVANGFFPTSIDDDPSHPRSAARQIGTGGARPSSNQKTRTGMMTSLSSSTGTSPGEIATYIFLALFALLGAAFALHCLATSGGGHRSSMAKLSSLSVPDWIRSPLDRLSGLFWNNAVTSARQEFVWVGPDELRDSLTSKCSRRLLHQHHSTMGGGVPSFDDDEEEDDDAQFCRNEWSSRYTGGGRTVQDGDMDDEDYEIGVETSEFFLAGAESRNATYPGSTPKTTNCPNRISYLGSEVSIVMCQKPLIEVHGERRASSWHNGKSSYNNGIVRQQHQHTETNPAESCRNYKVNTAEPFHSASPQRYQHLHHHRRSCPSAGRALTRIRITSNPIGDSSSEQNLSSFCAASPSFIAFTAHSVTELNWDSTSLGMNETQLRDYFNSLRESMA